MGGLLCALTVATPWMFGTTQEWSVRLMNLGCALLGLLFIAAWIMERTEGREGIETSRCSKIIGGLFFGANLLVLGFCAVAWVNYRATFSVSTRSFTYNPDYNPSLPFTYDRDLTLQTLVNLAALFGVFWVARYWLLRGRNRGTAAHRGIRIGQPSVATDFVGSLAEWPCPGRSGHAPAVERQSETALVQRVVVGNGRGLFRSVFLSR